MISAGSLSHSTKDPVGPMTWMLVLTGLCCLFHDLGISTAQVYGRSRNNFHRCLLDALHYILRRPVCKNHLHGITARWLFRSQMFSIEPCFDRKVGSSVITPQNPRIQTHNSSTHNSTNSKKTFTFPLSYSTTNKNL